MPISATNPDERQTKKKKTSRKHPLFKCFALYSRRRSDVLLDLHQCNPFPPVALCYIMADQPGGRPSGRVASLVLQSGYISRRLDTQICHWQGGRDGHRASPPPLPTLTHPFPLPPACLVFRNQASSACCMLTRNRRGLTSRSHANLCRWCPSSASPVRPSLSPRSGTQSGIH